jgi:argininosuccinate lyase
VRGVVDALTPAVERSGRAASGLLLATDVADYLVARGMPFRTAHEVVGAMVRRLLHDGKTFDEMTLDEWRAHSPLFEDDVRATITARASIEKKQTPQSTSPEAVAAALAETREWIRGRT